MLRTGTDSTGMLQDYTTHRRFSVEADGIAKTSISAFCSKMGFELHLFLEVGLVLFD